MYHKSWRYYRDSTILWLSFFLMLALAGYALRHPIYWAAVLLVWGIRSLLRRAFAYAHPFRQLGWIGETFLDFRDATFPSRDGLTLFGRFVRSKNQATILVLHPLGSSSSKMLLYAEALVKAGYGVFIVDLRAHGSSDGDTSTNGLREADDVAGAADYLLHRLDVNGQKIGVLGISLGAQAALRGALQTDCLRALVLDSLGPATLPDYGDPFTSWQQSISYPFYWVFYRVYEFMGAGRNTSVIETIGKLGPRPILLIASGKRDIYFGRRFFQAAQEPKELWEIPEGEHNAAILQNSSAYIQRVVGFFDKTLL